MSRNSQEIKERENEKREIRRLAMKSTINALIVTAEDAKAVFIGCYPSKVSTDVDTAIGEFIKQCDDVILDLKLIALQLGFKLGTT